MVIFKRGQGYELLVTRKQIKILVRVGTQNGDTGWDPCTLITWQRCPSCILWNMDYFTTQNTEGTLYKPNNAFLLLF